MKVKLDLGKFKLMDRDDKMAELIHPDGHSFKIAIGALHPHNRKNLDAIEIHPESKYYKGGKVKKFKSKDGLEIEEIPQKKDPKKLEVEEIKPLEVEQLEIPHKYADGGEIPFDQLIAQEQADSAPFGVSPQAMRAPAMSGMDEQMLGDSLKVNIPGVTEAPALMDPAAAPVMQDAMPQPAAPAMNQASMAAPTPAAAIPSAPSTPGMPSGMDITKYPGMQKQMQAITDMAKAQADLASSQEMIQKAQIQSTMKIADEYKQRFDSLEQERKGLIQAIQEEKVDPNRYMGSMDFGQKVLTSIGLALGGFAKDDTALKILQKNIDNDIAAQKANLGRKESLLSANLRQFGNLQDAMNMTRVMQADIVKSKLEQQMAKASNPMAIANGQKLIGEIEAKTAPLMQQMAMKQMLASAEKDPAKLPQIIDVMERIDPKQAKEMRDRFIPGVGLAPTTKDATDIKEMTAMVDNANRGIDELISMVDKPFKSVNLTDRAKAEAIQQTLVGLLRLPITGPGAMNEGERKMLEGLIANPTAIFSLDSSNKVRLKTLASRLEGVRDSMIKARGLTPPRPSDAAPHAEIKTVNGIPYRKVSGGWQRVK